MAGPRCYATVLRRTQSTKSRYELDCSLKTRLVRRGNWSLYIGTVADMCYTVCGITTSPEGSASGVPAITTMLGASRLEVCDAS